MSEIAVRTAPSRRGTRRSSVPTDSSRRVTSTREANAAARENSLRGRQASKKAKERSERGASSSRRSSSSRATATSGGAAAAVAVEERPSVIDRARAASSAAAASRAASTGSARVGAASSSSKRAAKESALHRFRLPLAILAVSVAAVVMLYGPVKQLYSAWRTGITLTSSYESIQESNDALTEEIDRLQTQEGIEDEARENGYVYEGETSVVVSGIPEDDETESTETEVTEDPWYLQLGDFVFQYEES